MLVLGSNKVNLTIGLNLMDATLESQSRNQHITSNNHGAKKTAAPRVIHREIAVDHNHLDKTSAEWYEMHLKLAARVSVKNTDNLEMMQCLVTAVHTNNPDPSALYAAGTSPLYARLHRLQPGSHFLSPYQCLKLATKANYPDAEFQLAKMRYQHEHDSMKQGFAYQTIENFAKTGHLEAIETFTAILLEKEKSPNDTEINLYKTDAGILIHNHEYILTEILKNGGKTKYLQAMVRIAQIYDAIATKLINYHALHNKSYNPPKCAENDNLQRYQKASEALLLKASGKGSADAAYLYAMKLREGYGDLTKDQRKELVTYYVLTAHKNGHPNAGLLLGDLYQNDANFGNSKTAMACYEIAADYGNAQAAFELVKILYSATFPDQHKIAGYLYTIKNKLDAPGNAQLRFELGEWYLTRTLFSTSEEEISWAQALLKNVKEVPSTFPKLKKMFDTMPKSATVSCSTQSTTPHKLEEFTDYKKAIHCVEKTVSSDEEKTYHTDIPLSLIEEPLSSFSD